MIGSLIIEKTNQNASNGFSINFCLSFPNGHGSCFIHHFKVVSLYIKFIFLSINVELSKGSLHAEDVGVILLRAPPLLLVCLQLALLLQPGPIRRHLLHECVWKYAGGRFGSKSHSLKSQVAVTVAEGYVAAINGFQFAARGQCIKGK